MAVRAEVTNRGRSVRGFDDLRKLSLTDEFDYDEAQMEEPASSWCGGDFPGEEQEPLVECEESPDDVSLIDNMKYKDTLIEELLKSNHELRMKFAEAENKIAKMRARMDSHCECCTRKNGEDGTETKRYKHIDWSTRALHSIGVDSPYTIPFKAPQDNTNPYVKVRRWQNAIHGELTRAESTCSTTTMKSPNSLTPRSCNTRPESPATRDQGVAGNYMFVPLGKSASPSGFRRNDIGSRCGSPQKLITFMRNQEETGYEIDEGRPLRHLPTVKSSPDERILSSRQQHPRNDFTPSAALRVPRNYDNVETRRDDHNGYYAALQKTKKYILTQHANVSPSNPNADDRGIVGRLMGASTGNEHK